MELESRSLTPTNSRESIVSDSDSNTEHSDNNCGVCFYETITQITSCGHGYCDACYNDWFVQYNMRTCPACRTVQTVVTDSEVANFIVRFTECHVPTLNDQSVKGIIKPMSRIEADAIKRKINKSVEMSPTLANNVVIGYNYAILQKGNNFLMGNLINRTQSTWTIDKAICMQRTGVIYPCSPSIRTIKLLDAPTFYRIL